MEARESASANSVNPDATRELVDKAQRRSTNPPKAARRLFQGPLTKILPSEERSNGMDECQKLKLELTKQNAPDDSEVYVFYLKTGTGRILGPFVFSCHPSKTCKEGEEEKAECSLSASVFATTQQNYCSHCKKPVIVTQEGSFRFFDNAGETAIAEAGCLSPKQRREYIGVKKVLQKLNSVIKDPVPSGQSKEGEAVLKPYHDTALSQLLANALGEEGLSIIGSHISMNTNKAVRFNQRMTTNPNYQQHLFSLENTVLRLKKDVDRLQTENAHLRSSQPQFVYSYPYGLPSPLSNLPRYVTPTVVEKAVQYNFEPPTLVDMSGMAEEGLLHEIQTENRAFRTERKSYVLDSRETAPAAAREDMFLNRPAADKITEYNYSNENDKLCERGYLYYHRVLETFKFIFAKRSHLSDEAFLSENATKLLEQLQTLRFADELQSMIVDEHTQNLNYYGSAWSTANQEGTSHVSILADNGDAVAVTSTINTKFGSKMVGRRTGVLFNNEMDDFSSPNTSDYFGLAAARENFIRPAKRPLSSMSPVIFTHPTNGSVRLVIGASGGSLILTSVVNSALDALYFNMDIKKAIDDPRLHHQLLPNHILPDANFPKLLEQLQTLRFADELQSMIVDEHTQNLNYYGSAWSTANQEGTSHVSILADNGDAVAVTSTINTKFGSKMVGRRTGVLFNNEMDDFSSPNTSDYFGLAPARENFIRPGKRPLSSMSPVIFTHPTNGSVRLVIGASGGSLILTSVVNSALDALYFNMDIKKAIDDPRLHHQLLPNHILPDGNFPKEDDVALKFFLKNQDKLLTEEACGPMSKLFKKRLADRAEEDKEYAKIVIEAEQRRKRLEEEYNKKAEEFEARRRRCDTAGIEQLDMRPASPATRHLLYTGVSSEGLGRYACLTYEDAAN
nr:unnamed protein product [Spirometra erinaceieuropaei]